MISHLVQNFLKNLVRPTNEVHDRQHPSQRHRNHDGIVIVPKSSSGQPPQQQQRRKSYCAQGPSTCIRQNSIFCTHNSGPNRPTEELHCLNREKPLIRTLQPIAEEGVPAGPFLKEDDLFALGLESLNVTNLVRHINDSWKDLAGMTFEFCQGRSNPTVHHLARTIMKMTDKAPSLSHELAHMEERMRSILEHFFKDLPLTAHKFLPSPPEAPKTVNLTDPAGTIGSHLTNLLANPTVAHIYCFTRIHINPPFRIAAWCSQGKWFHSTLPTQS